MVRAGLETVTLSVQGTARLDGPIWIQLDLPVMWRNSVQYPARVQPDSLACAELEVRRNGVALPRLQPRYVGGMAMSGNPCGHLMIESHHPDRVPLHVLYRLRDPGAYEVRYTGRRFAYTGLSAPEVGMQSAWTPIQVLPAAPRHI